jgi:hypothetical protein
MASIIPSVCTAKVGSGGVSPVGYGLDRRAAQKDGDEQGGYQGSYQSCQSPASGILPGCSLVIIYADFHDETKGWWLCLSVFLIECLNEKISLARS